MQIGCESRRVGHLVDVHHVVLAITPVLGDRFATEVGDGLSMNFGPVSHRRLLEHGSLLIVLVFDEIKDVNTHR